MRKLTLPEMGWRGSGGAEWTEKWRFAVGAIAETKGVVLEDGKKEGEEGSDSGSD